MYKRQTHLSDFRKESRFSTWVFRIAVNHVLAYRKHMFSHHPLSFEYYGEDIANGREEDVPDMTGGVDRGILEEELKLSCTNVMLQCLDGLSLIHIFLWKTDCLYISNWTITNYFDVLLRAIPGCFKAPFRSVFNRIIIPEKLSYHRRTFSKPSWICPALSPLRILKNRKSRRKISKQQKTNQ